jgi:hypothetical protein
MGKCTCTCGKIGCASGVGKAHGSVGRYDDGCRCEECTRAKTDRTTRRKKRVNDGTQDSAVNRRKPWTGPELEIATRDDLTAAEAAKMLGRSYAAVMMARHRCANDPKWGKVLGARLNLTPENIMPYDAGSGRG